MKQSWMFVSLFSLVLALGAAGCGDDDDDGGNGGSGSFSCGDAFQACGGTAAGSWNIVQICNPMLSELDQCPEAVLTITRNRSTGTANLGDDGNYTRTYDMDFDFNAAIPASCTMGMTCAQLAALTGLTCADAADGCNCSGTTTSTIEDSGTWEIDGNDIVTDAGTADEARLSYCVDGSSAYTQDEDGLRTIWSR